MPERKEPGKDEVVMIADKMKSFVKNSSAIRAMFEEGKKMAEKYGAENVYDFSLGNPNVPAPVKVKEAIIEELEKEDPVNNAITLVAVQWCTTPHFLPVEYA